MREEKTSVLNNGLIWFGAAVSIAEIFTGTLLAPLGFSQGVKAILLGHLIGCILLFLAGLIGARTGKSAMETVRISFGSKGAVFFAGLNILQLVGWTAVMIISGARGTGLIANPALDLHGELLWCGVIGALIIVWIVIGIKNMGTLNVFAMSGLFLLTIVLSFLVFNGKAAGPVQGTISFGAAVELSAAMPLSWLPLISDYTRQARKPQASALTSVAVYFAASCWMYIIGLGATIFTAQSDVAQIMLSAGLGIIGVLIIIFATVTTTFLDAYSAGVSFTAIKSGVSEKKVAVTVCVIGTVLAMFTPIEQYENFLYLIGSVFAPMTAILLTDYFILKQDYTDKTAYYTNFALWIVGFIVYRWFMSIDIIVGNTLPVMIIISILCILVKGGKSFVRQNS